MAPTLTSEQLRWLYAAYSVAGHQHLVVAPPAPGLGYDIVQAGLQLLSVSVCQVLTCDWCLLGQMTFALYASTMSSCSHSVPEPLRRTSSGGMGMMVAREKMNGWMYLQSCIYASRSL
eukprot:GHUV01030106.1.p1 GENE.GHUV01030106.1~~GHUV01030106.1.p1  ORF type:complete len:118 (-),score=19.00 GHUV01030106.1:400-753(-)